MAAKIAAALVGGAKAQVDSLLPPRNPALKQVATGCPQLLSKFATNKQMVWRKPHIATSSISNPQFLMPNWYVDLTTFTELGVGAVATITCFVEYPAGTLTRVTFSGGNTGTIPDGGMLLSDPAAGLSIPKGAMFWTQGLYQSTAGTLYKTIKTYKGYLTGQNSTGLLNVQMGARYVAAVSGLTDPTVPFTGASTGGDIEPYGPVAIVAPTRELSVLMFGDSRAGGYSDDPSPDQAELGLTRCIRGYGVICAGRDGDSLVKVLASSGAASANRRALAAYVTDVVIELGINDLNAGRQGSQVKADLATLRDLLPASPRKWLTTYPPITTGTFTDLAGQTVAPWDAQRIAINNDNMNRPSGFAGCLDFAGPVESGGLNASGKWTPDMSYDGTHQNPKGYKATRDYGAVPPGVFG